MVVSKRFILFIACVLTTMLSAQNTEREQQFTYYYYVAHEAIEQQRYDKAFVLLHFCEQLNHNDGRTKEQLGFIYAAVNKTDTAMQYFAEAYRLAPDDCWQHYAMALVHSGTKADKKTVRKVMESVVKRNPKDADALSFLQNVYLSAGEWSRALKLQDRLDALLGYNANSALTRYRIYTKWGKATQAVQAIDDYLEFDPTSLYFLLFRADIYLRAHRNEDAFNLCLKMAKLFPLSEDEYRAVKQNPFCAYYLAHIKSYEADSLAVIGEIEESFATYEEALFLNPQDAYIMNNYAYRMALNGGDLIRAEQISAECIKVEPNNPYYLDTYGWILHLRGQNSLALFYLRKALENTDDPEVKAVTQEHINEINGQ